MSSRLHFLPSAAAIAALLAVSVPALAQSDDADAEMRIERLENQLRQLTGQNEELQYRNRQLEERLRQLGAQPPGAPGQPAAQPSVAAVPPAQQPQAYPQAQPGYGQPQQGYGQSQPGYGRQGGYEQQPQIAAPAPIVQEPTPAAAPGRRGRGDAFDPSQNPNAPGAPRALGGGQLPMSSDAGIGAPGGRGAGEPLDLGNTSPQRPPVPAQA